MFNLSVKSRRPVKFLPSFFSKKVLADGTDRRMMFTFKPIADREVFWVTFFKK